MRRHIEDVAFAVDEHIWGHRLYDEQLPHLTMLEFLNVLLSNSAEPLKPGPDRTITYKPQRQFRLRSLLFNNPYVEAVRARPISDEEKWKTWEALFAADATGQGDNDMAYLRRVFLCFDDFARAIELLRSSAFEAQSNKRWSSKFAFPFGPDALYEDLRFNSSGVSNDRRFFARTGELLYLMLSRASRGRELGQILVERLFKNSSPMNRLVRAIQGEPQRVTEQREVGYLPFLTHPRFERICNDWLSILSRDMPFYDALEHLITITGLNMLLYFLECGKHTAGSADPVEIVCEIVSRERTKVRALSGESFQRNEAFSLQAIRASIEAIRATNEWEKALAHQDPSSECAAVLRANFQWPPIEADDEVDPSSLSGEEMISKLLEKAEFRHEQHFGKIHSAWSRAIGLSSRRLSRRTRYAPNDKLLKSLVVTIVDSKMQFNEFLYEVHKRYGLVIGDAEGARLVRDKLVDQEALTDNRGYMESRLLGLGMLRRLSDSCSFVENPFTPEGDM